VSLIKIVADSQFDSIFDEVFNFLTASHPTLTFLVTMSLIIVSRKEIVYQSCDHLVLSQAKEHVTFLSNLLFAT